jgi:hypothetical protein
MNVKDLFEFQLKHNSPVTEVTIQSIVDLKFESGREINVGDQVLWASLKDDDGTRTVVIIHPDDLNLYSVDRKDYSESPELPRILKRKSRKSLEVKNV